MFILHEGMTKCRLTTCRGVVCKARPDCRVASPSSANPRYHLTTVSVNYSIDRTDGKALDTNEKQEIDIDVGSAFYHQRDVSTSLRGSTFERNNSNKWRRRVWYASSNDEANPRTKSIG